MSIDDEIKKLHDEIKHRLNELKNLYRESRCQKDFIKDRKMENEYEQWRKTYYNNRTWKIEKQEESKSDKTNK